MAYRVKSGNKVFVVIDGKEEKQYDFIKEKYCNDNIVPKTLIFSPDSKHLAYRAESAHQSFVVVDGKEEKKYDFIKSLIFSPDSRHMAYVASVVRPTLLYIC
jgi:hypothetical protein